MKVASLVNIRQSLEDLVAPSTDPGLWEILSSIFHDLINIMLLTSTPCTPLDFQLSLYQIFKHKVQIVVFSYDLLEFDNIGTMHFLQRLDFAQVHAFIPRIVLALHLLDSHLLAVNPSLKINVNAPLRWFRG